MAKVLVNVGKDVFVEFQLLEAFRFCHEKIFHLKRMADALRDRQQEIRQHIEETKNYLEMLTMISVVETS